MTEITWVYRAFDRDDVLLYVGLTKNPTKRLCDHKRRSQWYPLATTVRWCQYADRLSAELAELVAIRNEDPAFNVDSSRVNKRKPYTRRCAA